MATEEPLPTPTIELKDAEVHDDVASAETPQEEEGLQELKKELSLIWLKAPTYRGVSRISLSTEFPDSYKENNAREKEILIIAENFRRQYLHLYRDRKALYVYPVNECSVEKLVCLTLRPALLPFIELHKWQGAANFVADYLDYEPLDPPIELPVLQVAPMTTLRKQSGNCLDFAMLLCSLLLGAGYDAYVATGYASREICNRDQTREECPFLKEKPPDEENIPPKPVGLSRYEIRMKKKKVDAEIKKEAEIKAEKLAKLEELEKPPTDPLKGLRVHAWIVILEGKREIAETFFIEPLTGHAHSVDDHRFHGIESIWNHQNYWVNMQDCSDGCGEMMWDLLDCTGWEYMFNTTDRQLALAAFLAKSGEEGESGGGKGFEEYGDEEGGGDKGGTDEEEPLVIDMPPSWTEKLFLTPKQMEMRYPAGKKVVLYKKAKLEKYAPYIMEDGLMRRVTTYDDNGMTDVMESREYFQHRVDKLSERVHNYVAGFCTEKFVPGRRNCLRKHVFKLNTTVLDVDRTMTYYHKARVDGLEIRRELGPEMTEKFMDRYDNLYHRQTLYKIVASRSDKSDHKPGGGETNRSISYEKRILRIVERFHHDPLVDANDDIEEIVYDQVLNRITLRYHTAKERVTASVREFRKPTDIEEKGYVSFDVDLHTMFQVDPKARKLKNVELYEMLIDLLKKEENSKLLIKKAELETKTLLEDRLKEEVVYELEFSKYDTGRNRDLRLLRRKMEAEAAEEEYRRRNMGLDYLAPFLAKIDNPPKLTWYQAQRITKECFAEFKQGLVEKANLILRRIEQVTIELERLKRWYYDNLNFMLKEDEEEYYDKVADNQFNLHILQLRLARHCELAPVSYKAFCKRIWADHRIEGAY